MKNFLNCHSKELHSFPISFENGLYRRVFYADNNHFLWRPFEVAVHPHHVDIKITVLDGVLCNPIFTVGTGEMVNKWQWNSHILNGSGGFEYLGEEKMERISNITYKAGESVSMKACELHTIVIEKGKKCVWLIEESMASCDYFPINYSPHDLSTWSPDGLYLEVDDVVKEKFIGKYLAQL